ncbi:acyl-CoA dehydrogenase family protein [Pseudoduganella namucuonensis]|uniref:Acyl-CoA dehydrogenase n=1 Tax=Pseudoduganella namucuonensis TaxID=1035707 RepID=A0A1I7LSG4_9BURK|nr:acyl-CoA dehydrogenase family protein [Pseudoduganella namucuonensis]SFV12589.1 Acyl-CoA dehydrogenase [Pseudoduganella namucuonensis]
MDFTFTPDQREFRQAMCNYLMNETTPELARELWETDSGRCPAMWSKFAEQGLTGLSVPEQYGGLGCGDVDWVLLAQDLGYYAVPDSLLATAYVAVGLLNALPEDAPARAAWLPGVVDGSVRIAVGHPVEPLVADAHVADMLLLPHAGEVHAVPAAAVRLTLNPSIDPARRLYRVEWEPSAATRVADAASGTALWAQALNRGALAAAAQMLGLTQRMLDLAIDYSAQRKQFGKPIGSFQAVKHHLADVAVKAEFARPVAFRAAHALAHAHPLSDAFVSHAKLAAGEAAWLAARKAIQVHGAMGYTWEMDLQMFMKRAWVLDPSWGDRGFHKQRVAELVLGGKTPLGPGATFDPSPTND